ncbi:uncharacterized protein MELLADRAFT_72487 [Melampsora larici-populina 98AG31]|uniref:FAM50A/XAP5 C-terminal domain-containing protein n=1 Tax=Melampsora larici-populina (strain 98AG31 / pathotype 3-4-7) TaxID=747676 RepID=F4RUN8_MELLP|nr:uncharacterized protein MELLADRAFT_72487 [Melampsora larici-populina 98AG31]EGG03727.1 hypothetical protein MELLADRAFT_72487 [Melampsora larici-populina 98AG31]
MASSTAEKHRIAVHEKKRKEMMDEFERQKVEMTRETDRNRTGADRFVGKSDSMEESLKMQTVGLVKLEDFQQKRQALEEEKMREAARSNELKEEEPKKKKKKKSKYNLSFAVDEDEEITVTENKASSSKTESSSTASRKGQFGKNPTVDTSFLPDRDREELDRREREELRQKWLKMQEAIKQEDIEITYSYWDGTGHRKEVTCKKGDSIAQFLEKARTQWPELRGVSVADILYVKEDLIIPHHYTFYDFIVNKARGKSGPLFNFDAHDDVRLVADATVEKDESHAGKVVTRTWYNRAKHIFPASRWEPYVPGKDYGAYKIKG